MTADASDRGAHRPYAGLAGLPEALRSGAVVTGVGDVESRIAAAQHWLDALIQGRLPPAQADFGDPAVAQPMRQALADLGLAATCRERPALAAEVVHSVLSHQDRIAGLQPVQSRVDAITAVVGGFRTQWALALQALGPALALLPGLGENGLPQWDTLRGQRRTRDWAEARRASEALARQPALAAVLRGLGRRAESSRPPEDARPRSAGPDAPASARAAADRTAPAAAGEVRGIRLSSRLEGMLGSEAAQMRHPVLRRLWRVRRAEGRLLAWDTRAVMPIPLDEPRQARQHTVAARSPPVRERGPFILCLDTSGSMRGAPEILAKAVALEALRVAVQERRGCLLIAFGAAQEQIERELGTDAEGLAALLDLMGKSFDGGTDVQSPIERAVQCVDGARWVDADIVLVSDGEFGCTPAMLARLDAARARLGLRVQGILVGDRETIGLLEVCDHIHWVRDWRRHEAGAPTHADDFNPVHSKSLTALYFPNALSERAARRLRP